MSLFRVQDWWTTKCGDDETFTNSSICVGRLDPLQSETIVVGSLQGLLRIYLPVGHQQQPYAAVAFKPEHLLLEVDRGSPVISIKIGKFFLAANSNQLAVLHPQSLAVFSLSVKAGAEDMQSMQCSLNLVYEHTLERKAYSIVTGPFGGVTDREFLAVQSIDGSLSVFEQESLAFSRFIPNSLLPGPFVYVEQTDSFVIYSSSLMLQSFRYQVIAIAQNTTGDSNRGKRITPEWTVSLGEAVQDIAVANFDNCETRIIVLGEENISAFDVMGVPKFVTKVDFLPSCFHLYPSIHDERTMMLVVTKSSTLLVYEDTTLKWAANLPFSAVQVHRLTDRDAKGLIVALGEDGELSCLYMGTEPSFQTPVVHEQHNNESVSQMEQRLSKLNQLIAKKQKQPTSKPISNDLRLSVKLEDIGSHHTGFRSSNITILFSLSEPVTNAMVNIKCDSALKLSKTNLYFDVLTNEDVVTLGIIPHGAILPSTQDLMVLVTYQEKKNALRASSSKLKLPFALFAQKCAPDKNADYKITLIDKTDATWSVKQLFPEFMDDDSETGIGFEFSSGIVVSFFASETTSKYRIQSNCFPALWCVTNEVIVRRGAQNVAFSNPPSWDYFNRTLDDHFSARLNLRDLENAMGRIASQYRVVEKRLLGKLKNKTPTPLQNLDKLLEMTHKDLTSAATDADGALEYLKHSTVALKAAIRLLLLHWTLSNGTSLSKLNGLVLKLLDADHDLFSEGWEEKVECGILYLMHHRLEKNANEIVAVIPTKLEMPSNTQRLEKLLNLLFMKLNSLGSSNNNNNNNNKLQDAQDKGMSKLPPTINRIDEDEEQADDVQEEAVLKTAVVPTIVNGDFVSDHDTPQDAENDEDAAGEDDIFDNI